jgi:hypothetical protein
MSAVGAFKQSNSRCSYRNSLSRLVKCDRETPLSSRRASRTCIFMGPISMAGAGDLFSNLQPVTGNKSTLSLSAGRCGAAAPQKGSVETKARTQGKAFPSWCGCRRRSEDQSSLLAQVSFAANAFRRRQPLTSHLSSPCENDTNPRTVSPMFRVSVSCRHPCPNARLPIPC